MKARSACPECLRRSWLLAMLAPYIERFAGEHPGIRIPQLLGLANEDLVQLAAPKVAEQLLARTQAIPEARLTEELDQAECWARCRHSDRFPDSLRGLDGGPWALIERGDPEVIADLAPEGAVAIVGARRATSYGREIARRLGGELAEAGLLVASGLAFGIDGCAHRGAIDSGRTIAVLGCGPDIPYPASHRSLWRRITETGLVVSELPPGAPPWRWTFAARNRIIAGLAGMTVVVEAAGHSGAIDTAELAAGFGRRLGAVPGPVSSRASAGSNALLVNGARVVRDGRDVLDVLSGSSAS